jgi:hypothetical protein
MKAKYKLMEASETSPEVIDLLANNKFTTSPFFKAYMKNFTLQEAADKGTIRGQSVSDATGATANKQVAATTEILNSVIHGYNREMEDTFVRKYTMTSTILKVPKTEYEETADDIDATEGTVADASKDIDYATIDLTTPESERGAKATWTRNALEDTTFDIQGEMLEGLGKAIAIKVMKVVIAKLLAVTTANQPSGANVTISSTITWPEFLSVIGAVDTGVEQDDETYKTYGPADYCLVSPDVYWQLLNIIQMTNVLYEGSTDPVNKGIIKLALGCTIVKASLLRKGYLIALNSQKAVALGTRRTLTIEPIEEPEKNKYGFLGTVRCQAALLFEQAIQIGCRASS